MPDDQTRTKPIGSIRALPSVDTTLTWEMRSASLNFEDFYAHEFQRVYRAVWLMSGDEQAVADATQEAFARAFARWRRLADKEWAAGWVITTATNILRRRRPPSPAADVDAEVEAPAAAAVDLQRALRRIPARQRKAIVLYYVGDLSVHSVAELMGVSDGTVKAHLAQGRDTLRGLLEVRHV